MFFCVPLAYGCKACDSAGAFATHIACCHVSPVCGYVGQVSLAGCFAATNGDGAGGDTAEGEADGGDVTHNSHHELHFVQFTCKPGEYNEVATLLLLGAEGLLQRVFSRLSHSELSSSALAIVLPLYFAAAILVMGSAMPGGDLDPGQSQHTTHTPTLHPPTLTAHPHHTTHHTLPHLAHHWQASRSARC